MSRRRSHGSGCECSTCCKPKEEACCKPEKPCCKPEKPCCKAKKPCCCIPGPVGPVGPRGPRGHGTFNLPSGFAAVGEPQDSTLPPNPIPFVIPPGGPTTVLTVTVNSPIARELRITSHYSASAPGDVSPFRATFKIRVVGIDPATGAPNGSTVTFDAQTVDDAAQFRAGAIVRRYLNVPAGPVTVNLIVTSTDTAEIDPVIGGAALLVEQFAPASP